MFLNAKGTGQLTWILGDGIICKDCPNTQIKPTNSGCYQIQAINEFGCKAIDEVCIDVSKDYNIYIPNVFTPNADGNNDVFLVYGMGIQELELRIYNQSGLEVFSSNDVKELTEIGWDGKHNGKSLHGQALLWTMEGKFADGTEVSYKGKKTGSLILKR